MESAYEECLYYELEKYDLVVEKQKPLPLIYEDVKLDAGYRIDLLIDEKFIVEIKAVGNGLCEDNYRQTVNYMRASGCKLALLVNFGKKGLQHKRFVL